MQGMIQMDDKNPRVSGPKLSAVLGLQSSVQPTRQHETHDSDRGAQAWGTGERNTIGKHRLHYIQGCSELQTRTPEK